VRRILASVLAISALLSAPAIVPEKFETQFVTSAAEINPLTCEGYPEPRVFLEGQDWWQPIPGLGGLGHQHFGTCFPVGQTLTGVVRFDLVVTWHNNKGTLTSVKLQDDSSKDIVWKQSYTPATGIDNTLVITVNVNTALFKDGVRLFRWYANLTHENGNREVTRNAGWPVNVENGNVPEGSEKNVSLTQFKGGGWYFNLGQDLGYLNSQISTGIPLTPLSGTWKPVVKFFGNGATVTGSKAVLDPDFHHGNNGTPVAVPKVKGGTLSIDTTQLANGKHVLVLIAEQELPGEDFHAGVLRIPFVVQNGA
jgi:hypothetical protein